MSTPTKLPASPNGAFPEPTSKRQKLVKAAAEHQDADVGSQEPDQVEAALAKISTHISNPSKFSKAAPLLCQLLQGDVLSRRYRASCLNTIKAAFPYPANNCILPNLRKDFTRLGATIEAKLDFFGKAERAQLEVYLIWAVTQNQLFTDDSFVFSKVLSTIKNLVSSLPECSEQDEEVWLQVQNDNLPAKQENKPAVSAQAGNSATPADGSYGVEKPSSKARRSDAIVRQGVNADESISQQVSTDAPIQGPSEPGGTCQPPSSSGQPSEGVVDDPFGLDMLFQAPKPKPKPEPKASTAWTAEQTMCMKRQAVVDCLLAAKSMCKHAWACVGVELTIQHALTHMHCFCSSQRQVLLELKQFVQEQQNLRKRGPSAKEANRDTTSFERARAAWSQATVSHRGKVGSGGDHKSESWLG